MRETADERAGRGAALLDGADPTWIADMTVPDMGDVDCCVLGQLFGHYILGMRALGLPSAAEARRHGFLGYDESDDECLRHSWVGAIKGRQLADSRLPWLTRLYHQIWFQGDFR